ncbi:MAG: RNase adapter RapZ [Actinobacteria bacterium]|nr:RNase adapter RapZ [Actinomycetota bacterium]
MSGAGRTQVAKVLEDLDFFVIDNLPPTLLDKVVELAFGPGSSVRRMALVADIRGRAFFGTLVDAVRQLRETTGNVQVVFLEADDDTLVSRFEESRRRHPAAEGNSGVLEGIRNERELMTEIRGLADLIIDTSDLNVHELRDRVVDALGRPSEATLHINVVSFGFKHGAPRDADLVMDVRFLPNPHWVDELRPYNGRDEPVRDYVLGQPATGPFLDAFRSLLDVVVPGYVDEGKRHLTIAIGCTGGKHRSVAISEAVATYLAETSGLPVAVDHRDLGAE